MCEYAEWINIAQGDEGCWGKECICTLTGEVCDQQCIFEPEEYIKNS